MVKLLRQFNITSDMAYIAAGLSVLLSIAMWFIRRDDDQGQAERFGIFVGLWAPTLAVIGRSLEAAEQRMLIER